MNQIIYRFYFLVFNSSDHHRYVILYRCSVLSISCDTLFYTDINCYSEQCYKWLYLSLSVYAFCCTLKMHSPDMCMYVKVVLRVLIFMCVFVRWSILTFCVFVHCARQAEWGLPSWPGLVRAFNAIFRSISTPACSQHWVGMHCSCSIVECHLRSFCRTHTFLISPQTWLLPTTGCRNNILFFSLTFDCPTRYSSSN